MSKEYNKVEKLHNDIIPMEASFSDTAESAVAKMAADEKMTVAHAQVTQDVWIKGVEWANKHYTQINDEGWFPNMWFGTEPPQPKTATELYAEFLKTLNQ